MGLMRMAFYRVRKVMAWALALLVVGLIVAGAFWVVTELGVLA